MARRKKTSPFEDLVDLVAMLPWWLGCALALVSYLLLHRFATQVIAQNMSPGQIVTTMMATIWHTMASWAQYLVPMLCLFGAAISAFRRHQRQSLLANVASGKAADVLDGISWQEFELLVGEAFRLQGYQVTESGGGGADGGVDLVLRKGGEKFLVQCKQWKAFTVGVTVIRELYGVMAANGATGGFVVTSGRFTDEAKAFAGGRNVTLMDGPILFGLIKKAQASRPAGKAEQVVPPTLVPTRAPTAPSCPQCAKPMVQRTAKRGGTAGSLFWGCSAYPACRGTRQIG
jgi:restriction system protein